MQEYLPLNNFLRHQSAQCSDETALQSINAQLAYTQQLYSGRLSEDELQRRAIRMEHLKRRWRATFVDNRNVYRMQTARAVSKLCGVAA
ncbi:hypothetical protein ORI99_01760 [Alishewanella sp. SMS9]|nr:hypothetical protein [Alishewanella sp. SMS9]